MVNCKQLLLRFFGLGGLDSTMVVSRLRLFCVAMAFVGVLGASHLQAAQLASIRVTSGSSGTVAEITLDGHTTFKSLSLTQPNRLVVDLAETQPASSLKLPDGQGVVHSVRLGYPSANTVRVVFDLATSVVAFTPQMQTTKARNVIWIQWPSEKVGEDDSAPPLAQSHPTAVTASAHDGHLAEANDQGISALSRFSSGGAKDAGRRHAPLTAKDTASTRGALAPALSDHPVSAMHADTSSALPPVDATRTPNVPRPPLSLSQHRAKKLPKALRPLIVAIDPGHGGQDSGAIGPAGRREKEVTLAIGTELARLIRATPGMVPLMTRTSDVFIPLPQRAQIARAAKADLFVSIHADSTDNHVARGASVYVLSTKGASSQRARWIADKENAADLLGGGPLPRAGTTLANVLLDLAQSGHMKASEDVAVEVLASLKHVGNTHKSEIERANFVVLRTADMPAMLVETAFISNPGEERRLGQASYRHCIAAAIRDGIIQFFSRQPPPGTLFAARLRTTTARSTSAMAGSRP